MDYEIVLETKRRFQTDLPPVKIFPPRFGGVPLRFGLNRCAPAKHTPSTLRPPASRTRNRSRQGSGRDLGAGLGGGGVRAWRRPPRPPAAAQVPFFSVPSPSPTQYLPVPPRIPTPSERRSATKMEVGGGPEALARAPLWIRHAPLWIRRSLLDLPCPDPLDPPCLPSILLYTPCFSTIVD